MTNTTTTTLPSPPFITSTGIVNLRDCGGYPTQPGKVVRRGIVFRSAQPSGLTDEGVTQLNQLGIKLVYDLRSAQEVKKASDEGWGPVTEWEGAERIFAPVFRELDYSPEAIALRFKNYADKGSEGFVKAYQAILTAAADPTNFDPNVTDLQKQASPYRQILAQLSTPSSPPGILIHCTAGKDRTGVICALILSLCGVDDEIVAHEYGLTDLGFKVKHEEVIAQLMKGPNSPLGNDLEGAKRMIAAKKENMTATLQWIRQGYGSVEEYVIKEKLLTAEEIEQLRHNLIIDASEQEPIDWQQHAKLDL